MNQAGRVGGFGLASILAVTVALAGCAMPRFLAGGAQEGVTTPADSLSTLKVSTVTYVNDVCGLPEEQRGPALKDLNESLLPHHANIHCGRGGDSE